MGLGMGVHFQAGRRLTSGEVERFIAMLITLSVGSLALAQVDRARLNGRVVDTSGRALPQAHITAVQNATGFRRETISSPSGTYDIPELPVGIYDVSFVHDGFKALTLCEPGADSRENTHPKRDLALLGRRGTSGGVGEFRAVGYDIGRAADTRGTDADQGIASQRQELVHADGGSTGRGRYRRQQPAGGVIHGQGPR